MNGPARIPVGGTRSTWLRRGASRAVKTAAVALVLAFAVKLTAAEVFVVKGDCVRPEVPGEARILVWKHARYFAAGDIVVFRRGDLNFAGRVVAFDRDAAVLTVSRNGEPNQAVAIDDMVGRGIANTR
jgi:hypothetical protein